MTFAEAIDHLRAALASGKPHCFVQVSPQALAVVLGSFEPQHGEEDGRA